MRKIIAGVALAGVAVLGVGACTVSEDQPPQKEDGTAQGVGSKDATRDVDLGSVRWVYGTAEIPAEITNHSSKPSDYYIEATLYQDGVQVGTAISYVQRVQPGNEAQTKLVSADASSKPDRAKLTVVERTESFG